MKTFNSPLAFAQHLANLSMQFHVVAQAGLDDACKVIEKTAKDEIGTYQPAVGAFQPWAPLADSTVADRVAKGYSPDEPLLREGDLRDSIGREVHAVEAAVGSTSQIMVWQELGTSRMPPRAVLGPAAIRSKDAIERILGKRVFDGIVYGAAGAWTPLSGYQP
jgi:hypothetical protein